MKKIDGEKTSVKIMHLRARVASRLKLGPFWQATRFGLRRDLRIPLERKPAKIPISVREALPADLSSSLLAGAGDDPAETLEIARRLDFAKKQSGQCFIAIDESNGLPCYMQWLIGPEDAQRLGGFPPLAPNEALLENAYTPVSYRGLGIMAEAMALIAERALDWRCRYVLTFVEQDNIGSLKGCQRAGFDLHMHHHRTRIGFGLIKRDRFETLAEKDLRRKTRF